MGTDTPDAWARGKRDKAARYVAALTPIIARSVAAMCPGVPVAAVIGAMVLVVLAFNLLGDGLKDRLDPVLRR